MQNYQSVNCFFNNYIYKPSLTMALYPISWAFPLQNDDPNYFRKAILVLFSPLLLELTSLTCAVAIGLISSAMFIHAIAAVTAGLIDICSALDQNKQPNYQYYV